MLSKAKVVRRSIRKTSRMDVHVPEAKIARVLSVQPHSLLRLRSGYRTDTQQQLADPVPVRNMGRGNHSLMNSLSLSRVMRS